MSVFLGLVCAGIAIFIFVSLIINSFKSRSNNINRKVYKANKSIVEKNEDIKDGSRDNIIDLKQSIDLAPKVKLDLENINTETKTKTEAEIEYDTKHKEEQDIKIDALDITNNVNEQHLDIKEDKSEEENTIGTHNIQDSDRKVEFGDDLFTLFILAKPDQSFEGYTLYQILIDEGLIFGDMDIFHYFSESESSDPRHVFSIAQATESGTFDLDAFGSKSYQGICIVMNLNSSSSTCRGDFELMLEKSYNIAKSLNGLVYDQDKNLLRNTELENYYNEIFSEKTVN